MQAELLILRLSRNSGVFGLAGMPFTSQLFPTNLHYTGGNWGTNGILMVRPLLEFGKDDMYKVMHEFLYIFLWFSLAGRPLW